MSPPASVYIRTQLIDPVYNKAEKHGHECCLHPYKHECSLLRLRKTSRLPNL